MLSLANNGSGGQRQSKFGPYRVCLELESGGMATVYLAHAAAAVGRQRVCALKVIHPHLEHDPMFIEMFLDEAEIASKIRHANVCAVFDYGVVDGHYYIAMEHLMGESLAAIFKSIGCQRPENADRLARCTAHALSDACEGLHAAHDLKNQDGEPLHIVHRDVSPENILLTYDGIAKIVDFGVASASRKRHRTSTGIVKGKFAYVAPEMLREKARPDRRADVWGIGVVAWELVTGQRLFRRESEIDTLRAICEDPIVPPSKARPGLPRELDDIVMRALSRDPDARYATARDLGKDLARFATADGPIVFSDLAEWMEELFPGGKERGVRVLELAEQLQLDGTDRRPSLGSGLSTGNACSSPATEWVSTSTPPRSIIPRRAPRLWALLAGATVIGGVTGGVMASWGPEAVDRALTVQGASPPVVAGPLAPSAAKARPTTGVVLDGTKAALVPGSYVVEIDRAPTGEIVLRILPPSGGSSADVTQRTETHSAGLRPQPETDEHLPLAPVSPDPSESGSASRM